MDDANGARFRAGLGYGLAAYTLWGLVPLYFSALKHAGVPALEILAHRIAWSLPVLMLLTACAGGFADLGRVFRSRKLVLTLLASSLFLAVNWLLYIYATVTGRVTEASLGYYMMPLVNAALATTVLGERLRPLHYPALALVALGVAIPFVAAGTFTWLAVLLPVSFGVYGLIRKRVAVESVTGLTVESLLMLPLSLGYLVYLSAAGENHFAGVGTTNALLAVSGVVTVTPLLLFTLSIRRLPLLAVSFIQFVSPTVQMLLAVTVLGETLTPDRVAAFVCVWVAVAVFVGDAVWQARESRRAARVSGLLGTVVSRAKKQPAHAGRSPVTR
ncbi:EamA family transporter RarD [Urbifossiella limnaea]|uniref:EamA-like transporter family protein n=1 Tax=Urbifossiella limnaea TaxID=2528023 RepID=A0A517XLD2_9BACT|nr:EamA family transporter RarD [Urbifossiella limnaea]QDU18321.1 EamA-like transporter family protein [Urbifossiella limnaea]